MNLNAAALRILIAKGMTLEDVAEFVAANEVRQDTTAAERKRRQRSRDKSRRDVTRDPPNDNTLTPEVSEPNGSSPQPWQRPVGVSGQVWKDLLENRRRKRQPNTPTAWKRFQDDLARVSAQTGIPPPKLIEHAAAQGWAGIYDPTKDSRNDRQTEQCGKTTAAIASLGGFNDDRPM